MTTTREAALEAALENIRELNMTGADENGCKWANSDLIEQEIVFAMATPATEPQGYVEGLEAHIRAVNEEYTADQDGPVYAAMDGLMHYPAARAAPHPAADMRVVTVALLGRAMSVAQEAGEIGVWRELNAIVGGVVS